MLSRVPSITKKMKYILYILFLIQNIFAYSSTLQDIRTIHQKLLVLHFIDGNIKYHGYHQTGENDEIFNLPLDIEKASQVNTYELTETGRKIMNPLRIGRKSKAHGISMKQGINAPIGKHMSQYVQEHWIYLELADSLKAGTYYTLRIKDLTEDDVPHTFQYDPAKTLSAAIHINTVGFRPDAPIKKGYISMWAGDMGPVSFDTFAGCNFSLYRLSDGKQVFSGSMKKQKDFFYGGRDGLLSESPNGNYVGTDVWECDFSSFCDTGMYKVVIDKIGCSVPFHIQNDIYRIPFNLVTRALYHQRSGIALESPYTEWTRPAPHNPQITPGFSLKYSHFRYMDTSTENAPLELLEAQIDTTVDASNMWGWYQDAGDWDAYTSHSVVPAFLLTTFELKPTHFKDSELNIPESGNGIPDILDEAGWLIHHYQRTKGPTGGNAGGRIEGDNYPNNEAGKGYPSYEDIRPYWIVYGEEPNMSYIYARLSAQYAYAFNLAEQHHLLGSQIQVADSIQFWTNEAIQAFKWAEKNLREGDFIKIKKNRADAAAWLFKQTGEKEFLQIFKETVEPFHLSAGSSENYPWGIWAFATLPKKYQQIDTSLYQTMKEQTVQYGEVEVTQAIESGRSFNLGTEKDRMVFLGHSSTPLVMPAILAYEVSKENKFIKAVYSACDYMLGGNPLDIVWITGLNEYSVEQAFHMDSWYNKEHKKGIIPGLIPYGICHPGDWMPGLNGEDNSWGWWDNDYNLTTCYPHFRAWPIHELWFQQRYSPPSAEFTIHQTIAPAVAVYGYLTNDIK